jgi:hypothetical protein
VGSYLFNTDQHVGRDLRLMEEEMNKLAALSKLAGAYHSLPKTLETDTEASNILADKFHYIRRSLRLEDLKPAPKNAEGLNPVGPKFF